MESGQGEGKLKALDKERVSERRNEGLGSEIRGWTRARAERRLLKAKGKVGGRRERHRHRERQEGSGNQGKAKER